MTDSYIGLLAVACANKQPAPSAIHQASHGSLHATKPSMASDIFLGCIQTGMRPRAAAAAASRVFMGRRSPVREALQDCWEDASRCACVAKAAGMLSVLVRQHHMMWLPSNLHERCCQPGVGPQSATMNVQEHVEYCSTCHLDFVESF